jgi:WD40 repeat protein
MMSCLVVVKKACGRWFFSRLLGSAVVLLALLGVYAMAKNRSVVLTGHWAGVNAVAYSPDGKVLASGGNDCSIKLWDCASEKEIASLEPPEGRFVHDPPRGSVYDPIEGKTPPFINSLSFSADGKTLAAGTLEKSIRLWDMAKKQQRLKIELDYSDPKYKIGNDVFGVAFSPDGKSLASASFDGVVRLWSPVTGKLMREVGSLPGIAYAVAFSPDGKALAAGGKDGVVKIWDLKKKELKYTLTRPGTDIRSVAVSPDGRYLASASVDGPSVDGTGEVVLWDFQTGKELAKLEGHKYQVSCVAFSPDGKVLASGGGSVYKSYGDVILWDVAKREQLAMLNGHTSLVLSAAFSPDGKHLATGSSDKTVRIWDVGSLSGR